METALKEPPEQETDPVEDGEKSPEVEEQPAVDHKDIIRKTVAPIAWIAGIFGSVLLVLGVMYRRQVVVRRQREYRFAISTPPPASACFFHKV